MTEQNELSFEEALEELEAKVARLEGDELSLAEALEEFETGVKLAKSCAERLDQAEEKIEIIKQEAEGITVEPYNLEQESEAD
jgi:exodeoxyribonuclease VII small subunit